MSEPLATRRSRAVELLASLALLMVMVAGCGHAEPSRGMETADVVLSVVDDTDQLVELARPASRVVSLVPSGTDIMLALDAVDRVVGRTNYDTSPEVAHIPSVGGGLDPSMETLVALDPDLVIAWAEAGPSSLRMQLEPLGIAVYGLRSQDTADVFRSIARLGHLVGRDSAGQMLAGRIRDALAEVQASVRDRPTPSVLYLVEHDPPRVAGPDTFISQIIGVAGGRMVFPDLTAHWPQVSLEEIVRRQPDVLMLPRLEALGSFVDRLGTAPGWRELSAVRQQRVFQIPPELMSRPGPQIAEAARQLRDRLHPDVVGAAP